MMRLYFMCGKRSPSQARWLSPGHFIPAAWPWRPMPTRGSRPGPDNAAFEVGRQPHKGAALPGWSSEYNGPGRDTDFRPQTIRGSAMTVIKAAAVQLSPVLYSREGTLDKVCRQILALGREGVQFATFPETVVPYCVLGSVLIRRVQVP